MGWAILLRLTDRKKRCMYKWNPTFSKKKILHFRHRVLHRHARYRHHDKSRDWYMLKHKAAQRSSKCFLFCPVPLVWVRSRAAQPL